MAVAGRAMRRLAGCHAAGLAAAPRPWRVPGMPV